MTVIDPAVLSVIVTGTLSVYQILDPLHEGTVANGINS
jgi:hypothetical protein